MITLEKGMSPTPQQGAQRLLKQAEKAQHRRLQEMAKVDYVHEGPMDIKDFFTALRCCKSVQVK